MGRPKYGWPKHCWGPKPGQHARGCRPGRPLCRWMRRIRPQRRTCRCGAYPFPHRKGSGGCGDSLKAERFYFSGNEEYCAELDAEIAHSNAGGDDDGDASFNPDEWGDEEE